MPEDKIIPELYKVMGGLQDLQKAIATLIGNETVLLDRGQETMQKLESAKHYLLLAIIAFNRRS